MKNTIISLGKFEKSPLKVAFDDYLQRMKGVFLKEIELKKGKNMTPEIVKKLESELILKNLAKNSYVIALDLRGKQLSSQKFAKMTADLAISGVSEIDFVIGGAWGFDKSVIERADLVMSLGEMTFAHMLVRVMLIEQIYRGKMINSGHPYHK